MDGMPVSVSIRNLTALTSQPPPNSERYTPQEMPIGIPTTHDSSNKSPDPTTALPMPPPSPTGRGVSTKNRKFSAAIPRIAMYARMTNRIPTAANVHNAVSDVITALTERRDRSERESRFIILLPSPTGRRIGDEGLALVAAPSFLLRGSLQIADSLANNLQNLSTARCRLPPPPSCTDGKHAPR